MYQIRISPQMLPLQYHYAEGTTIEADVEETDLNARVYTHTVIEQPTYPPAYYNG